MHILLANENRGRGGAERFTLQLGQRMQRAGARVSLACRSNSWLAQQGLDNVFLPYRGELDLISAWLARIQKVDVVHCQATRDLAVFGGLGRGRARLIKSEHSFLDSPGSAWLRRCYRRCQAIVPVSQALQTQMAGMLGFPLPYQVVYNAMDLPRLGIQPPDAMRDHTWIGYVGSLLASKQVDHVLRACASSLRTKPELRLLLAGEGPESEGLRALAAQLEVADQVWMPGHVEDPLPYLAGLTVLIQSSPRETFSLVAMEAMSLEVPVVGYAGYGLSEVVEDGQTGRLCPQSDPEGLGAAVRDYLENEEVRRQHGRAGRRRVDQCFSWDVILPQWQKLYQG
ncbi:glycosyltransferase family 4 protein [bacterium]|nr:glycosyltransferase family 4 protein [bacterium]